MTRALTPRQLDAIIFAIEVAYVKYEGPMPENIKPVDIKGALEKIKQQRARHEPNPLKLHIGVTTATCVNCNGTLVRTGPWIHDDPHTTCEQPEPDPKTIRHLVMGAKQT